MKLITETIVFNEERYVSLEALVLQQSPDSTLPNFARPALVVCPGGGYANISEGEGLPAVLPFLTEGYQTFILTYSIGDDSRYPNPLIDVSMAVRWVRANADRLNIDPDRVGIMGFSAGGNCAAMLATQWHLDRWKSAELDAIKAANMPELEQHSNQPNAAILCYATTDLFAFPDLEKTRTIESGIGVISVERLPESNPVDHVTERTCPVFLWHTAEDETVPAIQSIAFAQRLMESGVPVELHVFERGGHGLSVANRLTDTGDDKPIPPSVPGWINLAITWLNQRFQR